MKLLVILVLLSSTVTVITTSGYKTCQPPASGYPGEFAYTKVNDQSFGRHVYIGGLFNSRVAQGTYGNCGAYNSLTVQETEAFFWALRTVKQRYPNYDLLKGIEIGAFAWDFCENNYNAVRFLSSFFMCQTGFGNPPIVPRFTMGFVDNLFSFQDLEIAKYVTWTGTTQVSASASSTFLSPSKDDYHYFLRTVPSDARQSEALVAIAKQLGWKHIQVVHEANIYGRTGAKDVKLYATQHGVCVVQTISLPEDVKASSEMDEVVSKLLAKRETRGVVVYASSYNVNAFLMAVKRKNAKNVFTWFGPESWGSFMDAVKGVEAEAQGAVTLTIGSSTTVGSFEDNFMKWYRKLMPEQNTWNPSFKQYWMQKFKCKLTGMTSDFTTPCNATSHSLAGETMSQYVRSIILAADALVHGIESTRKNECKVGPYICTNMINDKNLRDVLYNRVRTATANINNKNVSFFDSAGESATTQFKIHNFRRPSGNVYSHGYHEIGYYEKVGNQINFEKFVASDIYAYDKNDDKVKMPVSICNIVCYACHYIFPVPTTVAPKTTPPTTTLSTSPAATKAPVQRQVSGIRVYLKSDGSNEVDTEIWAIVILILAGLGIVVAIFFEFYIFSKLLGTPLAQFRTLWLGQVLLLGIILCYLVCIAFAFEPTEAICGITRFGTGVSYALCFSVLVVKGIIILSSKTEGYLRGVYQLLLLFFAWLVQIVIDAEWLILDPPSASFNASRGIYTCSHTFEGHLISLVYVMFLILVGTLIAARTHGIITNHREGIFIGIAAGFSIPLWLAWTLTGSLHWNENFEDPVIAYGLFLNATLILFALFLPKVRQLNTLGVEGIYLEDDVPDDVYGGNVVMAPSLYKGKQESIYVNGGAPGVYQELPPGLYSNDPKSLYLKHPGSVRSAPPVRPPTRVLTVTNDLTGRPLSVHRNTAKAQSEIGYRESARFGDGNSRHSSRIGTLKKSGSTSDLGAL